MNKIKTFINQSKKNEISDEEIYAYLQKNDTFQKFLKSSTENGYTEDEIQEYFFGKQEQIPEKKSLKELPAFGEDITETAIDVGKGLGRGGLRGTATIGDLLNIVGLNPQEKTTGEEARLKAEFEATPEQLIWLAGGDDFLPETARKPISSDIDIISEELGLGTEAKTKFGKYAQRFADNLVSSATLGIPLTPYQAVLSSLGGQIVEELNGNELLQSIGEAVFTPGSAVRKASTGLKNIEKIKKIAPGISEEAASLITRTTKKPLAEGSKPSFTSRLVSTIGKPSKNLEKTFNKTGEELTQAIQKTIKDPKTGFQYGPKAFEDLGEEVLQNAQAYLKNLPIKNTQNFISNLNKIESEIIKKMAPSSQRNNLVKTLKEAKATITKNPQSSELINFYRKLNDAGNWTNPKMRERFVGEAKNLIKNTFNESGSRGKEGARLFEESNQIFQKMYRARDIQKNIEKFTSNDILDFQKFTKNLQKPEIEKLYKSVISESDFENLKKLSNAGQNLNKVVENLKGANLKKFFDIPVYFQAFNQIKDGDIQGAAVTLLGLGAKNIAQKSLANVYFDPNLNKKLQKIMQVGTNFAKKQTQSSARTLNKLIRNYQKELLKEKNKKNL